MVRLETVLGDQKTAALPRRRALATSPGDEPSVNEREPEVEALYDVPTCPQLNVVDRQFLGFVVGFRGTCRNDVSNVGILQSLLGVPCLTSDFECCLNFFVRFGGRRRIDVTT